jgi:outer membrane protein insertion porin family
MNKSWYPQTSPAFSRAKGAGLLTFTALTAVLGTASLSQVRAEPAGGLQDAPANASPAAPVIRAVSITGNKALPTPVISDAAAKASFGKPGDDATIRAAVEAVVQAYRERNFSVAQVISTEVSPDGVLRLVVAEGTVRRVLVRGNSRTRTGVILSVLETKPGSVYRLDQAKDDRNRLARLGIFADVVVAPVVPGELDESDPAKPTEGGESAPNATAPPIDASRGTDETSSVGNPPTAAIPASGDKAAQAAAPVIPAVPLPGADEDYIGLVDVVVRVKEVKTGNVAATVGYTDGTGLNGFLDLTENNVAGSAQRVAVQWQRLSLISFDRFGNPRNDGARQAFGVSFSQPALSQRSLAYGIDLYNKQTVFLPFFSRNQDTIRNYETRRGGSARVGRFVSRNAAVYLSARHDNVGYDDIFRIPDDLNAPLDLLNNANATVGALGLNLVLDGRNDADNPYSGYLNSIIVEQAGSFLGGNRSFGQVRADLRQYVALRSGASPPVFAMRLLGGTSYGDNVPLSEYFFLGGFDLLRGYNLYSIYGQKMVLGSAELRAPLSEGLQGVVFVDSGSAFSSGQSFSLKTGVGVGLRFLTPIGPIRVDVAQGSRLQTYVSLGQSF